MAAVSGATAADSAERLSGVAVLEFAPLRPVVDGFLVEHQPAVSADRLVFVRGDTPIALRAGVVVVLQATNATAYWSFLGTIPWSTK